MAHFALIREVQAGNGSINSFAAIVADAVTEWVLGLQLG